MSGLQIGSKIIQVEINDDQRGGLLDLSSGQPIHIWRGNDTTLLCLVRHAGQIADLSNITAVTIELWDATRTTTRYFTGTVAVHSATPSETNWAGGSDYHFQVKIPSANLNFNLGTGVTNLGLWLVFGAIAANGDQDTLDGDTINIDEDGWGSTPVSQPATSVPPLTRDEQYALFLLKHPDQAQEAAGSDGFWYVWGGLVDDGGTGKWHPRRRQVTNGQLVEFLDQNGVNAVP